MTPLEYMEAVRRVNPTRPSYAPGAHGPGTTACNFFAHDLSVECGGDLPQLLAREQIEWLRHRDQDQDWLDVDAVDAKRCADRGQLTLATWQNPNPAGHSHIAVVVPSTSNDVEIAQAGAVCFLRGPISRGFGSLPVRFFTRSP